MVVEIDGQPRQNDQRDRVPAHATANPLRGLQRVDLADGQAVVPGHTVPVADDDGSVRSTPPLCLACVA